MEARTSEASKDRAARSEDKGAGGRPGGLPWATSVALWPAVGLVLAANSYAARAFAGRPTSFVLLAAWSVPGWLLFIPVTAVVRRLVGSVPLDRGNWRRRWPAYGAVGILVAAAMALWDVVILRTLGRLVDLSQVAGSYAKRPAVELAKIWFAWDFPLTVLVFVGLVAAFHAIAYYRSARERELVASRLEAQLATAHLQLLKTQLQPHFLFNTLHSISALIHEDVEAADRMIAKLSELLRLTVDSGSVHEVPLRQEMAFIERYLDIEQVRFADRLAVDIDVDPATYDAVVPSMILQPLVENAIHHGIATRAGAGRLRIACSTSGGWLRLIVSDNGPGIPADAQGVREGTGLANTRARLAQLYGGDFRLELRPGAVDGLQATLALPLRTSGHDGGAGESGRGPAASDRR